MLRAHITAFFLCSSALFPQPSTANDDCVKQFISGAVTVTDVRLPESAVVEADLRNDSAYHVVGYGLAYVFDVNGNRLREGLPMYMLKSPLEPGEIRTHRMRLADFDLTADAVNEVAVNVISIEGLTVPGQTAPPTLSACQ